MEQWEQKAYDFARRIHEGDMDEGGKPQFETHILPVVALVKLVTTDRETITAAYLHDTIEDGDTNYEEVKREFGKAIADLVMEVTKEGPSRFDIFPRLRTKKAIQIKFADRLQNISRMDGVWDEKRQERYLRRSKFWHNYYDLK